MPKWKSDDRIGDHGGEAGPAGVARGRRPSTSRQDVARAALDLFARQGYDDTTVDQIAAAVGVSRRTFFRYYDSKREVVWGEFDAELVRLRHELEEAPEDQPMMDVLRQAVMATNRFGAGSSTSSASGSGLTSSVPTLVAHSAVRYAEWCEVVAGFVAGRIGGCSRGPGPPDGGPGRARVRPWPPSPPGPGTTTDDLVGEVDRAFRLLATGFDEGRLGL